MKEVIWYHLGKWIEPALAAEVWLDYAKYARQFFKGKLDGGILYLNGDFFLSQHDVDIMQKESYDAAKNKDKLFFDKLKKTIAFVSDAITKSSRIISSPFEFLESYKELTGVWMPLNIVSLGVEQYVNEADSGAFNVARGDTVEKPWTLKQVDEMRVLKEEIGTIPESIDKLSKELQQKIQNHVSAYEWKGSHHFSIHEFTVEELFNQMKEDTGERSTIKSNDSVPKYLIELLDLMGFIRFRCAEASGISSYYLSKHLVKLAKSHGMIYEDIVEHTLEELKAGEISKSIVEKRKKNTGFLFDKKIYILTDIEIKLYADKLLQDKGSSVIEIKGTIACKGKARGFVKLVRTKEEMSGFEKGMILVAYETTPDVIFAMKKAAAIVTDFGGLTSHAAVVSREFNIPCIVGAKIATKVLKDGDMVEVDADKGIVRKV